MSEPRVRWLEIELTYTCGMRCHNCNRMTQLLPGQPYEMISMERIERLISESLRLGYPWEHWWLVGGEPTTHPELLEICEMISRYRDLRGPDRFAVGLATNGHGDHTQRVLARLRQAYPHMKILNSAKSGPINHNFVAVCLAPIDKTPPTRYIGCEVSWRCGIALNYKGFYPCAVAAAIDRIFDIGKYITQMKDITTESMAELWQVYCALCGYHGEVRYCGDRTLVSPTWAKAIRANNLNVERIEVIED